MIELLLFFWRLISVASSLFLGAAACFTARIAGDLSWTASISLSAGVSLLSLIALLFLGRRKRQTEWAYVYESIGEARRKLRIIAGYRLYPRMWKLRATISRLLLVAKQVIRIVQAEPARFQRASQFFSLYVDSICSILKTYHLLISQPVKNKETRLTLRKTERMLQDLVPALEKELSHILADDVLHLQVELDVLEKNLLPDYQQPAKGKVKQQ